MSPLVASVVNALETSGIRYCHWKSNNTVGDALCGIGDIDFLVPESDTERFRGIMLAHDFIRTQDPTRETTPHLEHWYGYCGSSPNLIHFHIYFRIITGGAIFKNRRFKVETLLLDRTRKAYGILLPKPELDCLLLVLRKMIEQPSLIEHYLFLKEWPAVRKELVWLESQIDASCLTDALAAAFHKIEPELFFRCRDALLNGSSTLERVILGHRVRRLAGTPLIPEWIASLRRSWSFFMIIFRSKSGLSKRKLRRLNGKGMLLAFVGPESSGKSTLSHRIASWLNEFCQITHVHMGKPPATAATFLPRAVIAVAVRLRRILPRKNHCIASCAERTDSQVENRPHPIIALLDAYERRALVRRVRRGVSRGGIVVTDRYPSTNSETVDCPKIPTQGWWRLLSTAERAIYASIPVPDRVIKISAPLELTIARNSSRPNPEPENFLRNRHSRVLRLHFEGVPTLSLDNTGTLEDALSKIKPFVWRGIQQSA